LISYIPQKGKQRFRVLKTGANSNISPMVVFGGFGI
jgi:hypothetical protein